MLLSFQSGSEMQLHFIPVSSTAQLVAVLSGEQSCVSSSTSYSSLDDERGFHPSSEYSKYQHGTASEPQLKILMACGALAGLLQSLLVSTAPSLQAAECRTQLTTGWRSVTRV